MVSTAPSAQSAKSEARVGADSLSDIELSILTALASGLGSKEIARYIRRKRPTVETYVRGLFLKFNARSRAHLVALALRSGVLDPTVLLAHRSF
jgi:DNA-binding CsgD family transcriptional regulator